MNFSQFFIVRPIFASVLSLLIFIAGLIAVFQLPITEYPEVVPPTVVVNASYPGANPETMAETVATPLEQEINGVEGMLYMSSQATSDGSLAITVTFELGTDVDDAQVQVQNRVARAVPRLPQDVQRLGVTTTKSSPDLTMVVHLLSPDDRYDMLYLSNFAKLKVRDELARLEGVGNALVFGAGDYAVRIWLNPEKVAALGMTTTDVIGAIREQNRQAAAGTIGAPPSAEDNPFQLLIKVKGRLEGIEEFENVVLRVGASGAITRLKDVARVELGANSYALRSLLDNKQAAAIAIFQRSGSNAIQISNDVRARMAELQRTFPEGMEYKIVYDPTVFVRGSIEAVVKTLLEAMLLVVIVVLLFLQTWRASIIPLVAVPVSLVGTFAVMHVFGFSLNALTLFGLVLAIGIVVDDAIVVVENVERNIALGQTPVEATKKAMREVTGPIIATSLVLSAVFIPTAFISGLSGQFYKQFALTIAISTIISTFNSLTLSPALAAVLLKPHDAKKDWLSRVIDGLFGRFIFAPFNRFFGALTNGYTSLLKIIVRIAIFVLILYAGMMAATKYLFDTTPTGFVPQQDKMYLIAFAQLPDASSLDRTDAVIQQMAAIALEHPGIESAVSFPGLSPNGFSVSSNEGIVFVTLKPFEDRQTPDMSANAIAGALNMQFGVISDAFVAIFPPPPVIGLGTTGGFKLQIEDRANLGYERLYQEAQKVVGQAWQTPELTQTFSFFQVNVPQIEIDIDREKAKVHGVAISDIFDTLQAYMGSVYVNDVNLFGRTYQVSVQADQAFRADETQLERLKVRNKDGDMVPLSSFVQIQHGAGPNRVGKYNGYIAADINGQAAPGYSSGQAEEAIIKILDETLPNGMVYEWTDLKYQQILAGNTMVYIFPLVVLLVFLVLAAQYESWSMPMAIILIVPTVLLSSMTGVVLWGLDNNIFTQIGFIVLVGLAAKNAILIVEFAKEKEDEGMALLAATLEASKLRFRPILMTSIAFIMGVVPLVFSTGAGAEMREAMGVAVFSGMIGVTVFGLLLTPLFYVLVRRWFGKA
ncbi:multidrug efflux RND transporter permease subunit [Oleiphilus sp. HI0071]|uniref:efflux RND transporter permease subunit n=2 Tax=Oleiphilus TaxID=141450 RepID=UPI0007C215B4|nr:MULTISPECIES: multidrug efflux RND transporter permease subunit [unclassified Oleiphilus]KZY64740.1 multidrug efflux RND transporter permease subunit [Oleiphilus sp. HI0065]KZY89395.1 multidrug efflux RND transporter permease subunit [Oleiphilus sp. HI0071]KZZ04910.1 multidrug efflux RND transporter permease subunit [Oleiphilus sp. HI0073]KZZ56626.1 multidrug efflux RND transporter permease subunit [Oleiphilus sp. HI0122]KZZ71801.1 multidrug efflux RND transporter permease subunit [Oleiphil